MILSVLKALSSARSGGVKTPSAGADQPSGITRADFVRFAAIGGVALNLAPDAAVAATTRSPIAPVTDLDKLYDAWQSRFNAADIDGIVDLYVADVTYVSPEGKALNGKTGVRADLSEAFKIKPRIDIHDRKHLVYKDIALTTNRWTMVIPNADGTHQTLTGGGIEVMRKQADGGWRYIIDDASRYATS